MPSDGTSSSSGAKRKRSLPRTSPAIRGESRDFMPPPTTLPIHSPQRLSYETVGSELSDILTAPKKQMAMKQVIPRPRSDAVRIHEDSRWRKETNVASRDRHIERDDEKVHHDVEMRQRHDARDDRIADLPAVLNHGRIQNEEMKRKALLNDPNFVPPQPIKRSKPNDIQEPADALYEPGYGNTQRASSYIQQQVPPSPTRIDSLTDIARDIYRPSPKVDTFGRDEVNGGKRQLKTPLRSRANEPQFRSVHDYDSHEQSSAGPALPRAIPPPQPQSLNRYQHAIPATPMPLRQTHQSIASPYKTITSPFFRSSRHNPHFHDFHDTIQSFRMRPAQHAWSDPALQRYTADPQNAYQDPFYRGRESVASTCSDLVVPQTPRTMDGLFQRPDLSRPSRFQPGAAPINTRYGIQAHSSAPRRAAPLPSAAPSTSGLVGSRSSYGLRARDALGVRGARSGNLPMQSSIAPKSSRPALYGPASGYNHSRSWDSTLGGRSSMRR